MIFLSFHFDLIKVCQPTPPIQTKNLFRSEIVWELDVAFERWNMPV